MRTLIVATLLLLSCGPSEEEVAEMHKGFTRSAEQLIECAELYRTLENKLTARELYLCEPSNHWDWCVGSFIAAANAMYDADVELTYDERIVGTRAKKLIKDTYATILRILRSPTGAPKWTVPMPVTQEWSPLEERSFR